MDAALRLGLGYALHAVAARLEFQPRVRALPDDARDHLLVAAGLGVALRLAELVIQRDDAGELRMLPRLVAEALEIARRVLGGEQPFQVGAARDQAVELGAQRRVHRRRKTRARTSASARCSSPAVS